MSATVATVAAVMTSLNNAIAIVGKMRDLEQAEATIELRTALVNVKESMLTIKSDLIDKEEELKELQKKLKIQGEMKPEGPFYFRIEGTNKDGPFCQQCFDSESKVIRLHNYQEGWWECKTCEARYEKDYREGDRRREEMNRRSRDYSGGEGGWMA